MSTLIESPYWLYVNPLEKVLDDFQSHPLLQPHAMLNPQLERMTATIARLIRDSGLSQSEIAKALDVDKSSINKWIKGGRTPTMKNLIDLAELLGVEMSEIWEGETALPATPEQRAMMEHMRNMTPEQQQAFLAMASSMAGAKQ